jgi:hypothetical protein
MVDIELTVSRPWEPQDLLDDIQMMIDEEPDFFLNDRRATLCMARDYLKKYFASDTVEVVRCKDCKHYEAYDKPVEDFDGRCSARGCETDEPEFCSYGERRGEDGN